MKLEFAFQMFLFSTEIVFTIPPLLIQGIGIINYAELPLTVLHSLIQTLIFTTPDLYRRRGPSQ